MKKFRERLRRTLSVGRVSKGQSQGVQSEIREAGRQIQRPPKKIGNRPHKGSWKRPRRRYGRGIKDQEHGTRTYHTCSKVKHSQRKGRSRVKRVVGGRQITEAARRNGTDRTNGAGNGQEIGTDKGEKTRGALQGCITRVARSNTARGKVDQR